MITKLYGAPGTGKTTTLLDILVKEINGGIPLRKIAFLTHTVAARNEARARAQKIVTSPDKDAFRFFRTIHGICFREIGLSKHQVMQTQDFLEFGDEIGIPFSKDFSEDIDEDGLPVGYNSSNGSSILAVRQLAAARCQTVEEALDSWPEWIDRESMHAALNAYAKFKQDAGKFDFVDMLEMYCNEGEALDADVVIIDEAQDLSRLQWEIVSRFTQRAQRVYLGGDDDQSIYSFIGSDPHGFLRHQSDCDIVLPRTYRLKRNIFDLSQRIIGSISDRKHKQVDVDGPGGEIEFWNCPAMYLRYDEAKSTMVVARHHKQLSEISETLRERGIAFSHNGHSLVGTSRARAIHNHHVLEQGGTIPIREAVSLIALTPSDRLRALRDSARNNPNVSIDGRAILRETGINVNDGWTVNLVRRDYDRRINEQLEAIILQKGIDSLLDPPTIDLTTYHACKGREADHVILFTDCYITAFRNADSNPDEERRLAYVGVTRARDRLTIVAPETDTYMRALL